jgi:serine/threonine protein kinase
LWVSLHSIYEWICGIFSVQVCDVAMAPTLTMSWLYNVCTMFVGIRDYANIHYRLGISSIYFFKLLSAFKMNCLEQITTFYFFQIWSFIRFTFFGDVQISGREMESELELILVTMRKVEELTTNIDQIQLNKQLCNYLGKRFTKKRTVLERASASMSTLAATNQKKVLQEIHMVAKRGEALVQKCLCKESSWLDGAITLANVKEDVIEILLSLSWWTSVLKMTNADMAQATQNTTKALEKHDHLLEKFLRASSSLQVAAKVDMDYLLAKLKEVKDNHVDTSFASPSGINNQEYIVATYLLSQITGDGKGVMKEVDAQLKKFTWLALLGEGAGGHVAEVVWLNKKCALKIIRRRNIEKEEKEVTILKRCHHPHIVKFFWYWEDEKSHMMMEWMPKNLDTHIKAQVQGKPGTPFKLHVAIDIMLQVANAMRYLHNEKIVHRDLKTSNILVEPIMGCLEGYLLVKLADFGTAKPYNMTETFSTQTPGQGTPAYAAPEVNFCQPVVHGEKSPKFPPKADVWSFAMVCSEILTGEPPFASEPKATLRAKIKDQDLRPPLPNNCPDYLRSCITSCWELSPEKRPNFSTICTNLMVAKTMSLGIIRLDSCNDRFLRSNKIEKR